MERNDIVVLENLQQEDDQPRYIVVLAKEIENHAADGSSYDYSLEQWENGYSTFIDEETGYEIRFSQWYGHASMADVY